ncbi:EamA family transporter [Buchananella felis]|uniref:EamA family transporter n=1 Tax=Buchananella felis TaxID=3231492 RepID=UPI00352912DB
MPVRPTGSSADVPPPRRPSLGRAAPGRHVPAWLLVLGAIFSVQMGSALTVTLIDEVGPAGAAWLRLSAGALFFVLLSPPKLRTLRRADLPLLLGLGLSTGLMTTCFLASAARLPLGTAVAIEFLGPLGVAAWRAIRGVGARALLWPGLALAGVLLLQEPWRASVDALGVLLALAAAAGWAGYIVLTQRVGDRYAGLSGLALTVPIAAAVAAVPGVGQALPGLTWTVVWQSLGIALLVPLIPFVLELVALRRMNTLAFGTFMALEPAVAALAGAVVLQQIPGPVPLVGMAFVVVAGVGSQRLAAREA